MSTICPPNADNKFGPRVDTNCRRFDFTLWFEDAFFTLLPAAVFLLLLPWRLHALRKTPVRLQSFRLVILKLALLGMLFIFELLFLAIRMQEPRLYTTVAFSSEIVSSIAVLTALVLSFLEDQRSLSPSYILVLYFSASTICSLPRLRSLWIISSVPVQRALWTVVNVGTAVVMVVESVRKTRWLRPLYRQSTREQTAGFWSRSFFIWVLPFFQAGYTRDIQLADIPPVDPDLKERSNEPGLQLAWDRVRARHGRHLLLLRATFSANKWPFLSAIIPRLALTAFTFCQPFLVNSAVSYVSIEAGERQRYYGEALVGAFALVYLGIAISRAVYWRQTYRLVTRIRSALTGKIYRHTTALPGRNVKGLEAVTLMGTDVERIVDSFTYIHEVWASSIEVIIAIWLLTREISLASLVPLVVCVASVFGASQVATRFGKAQKAWNERVTKRISATISMLGDMKSVKLLSLMSILSRIIEQYRDIELQTSEKVRMLRIWRILVSNAPTTVAPFCTLATYAAIAVVKKDKTLLSAQAFSSLSLINLVTTPLLTLCQVLPSFLQGISCFSRIEVYCLKVPSSGQIRTSGGSSQSLAANLTGNSTELTDLPSAPGSNDALFVFDNADIVWSLGTGQPVLHHLSLTIHPGLTAIIGSVASGKSTLLQTMIGETILETGSMTSNAARVAFCSQTPWIIDDTIRRNITGGGRTANFDQKWYDFALLACGLQHELQSFPAGDQTLAGTNGISLSGGQRQRVALARAIYSRLPVVILDDVTSGLDSKTTSTLVRLLFHKDGYFRKARISAIIATHNRQLLCHMDAVVVLEQGRCVRSISGEEVLSEAPVRHGGLLSQSKESTSLYQNESISPAQEIYDAPTEPATHMPLAARPEEKQQNAAKVVNEVRRQRANWSTYGYYGRSAGIWSMFLWTIFTLAGAILSNITTIWIQRWTDANEIDPNQHLAYYLGVYACLVVLANASIAGECSIFFITIINNTARKMHSDLLETTSSASFSFFQNTDTASIINRFSQDIDLIDMRLPSQVIQFTTGVASCAVQLIVLCVIGKYLAATIPVLAVTLFFVQSYYLRTSRQVRLIDIEAKAPLYKTFIETSHGISTIRALGWQDAFHERLAEALDQAQRPFYMLLCIQQWLQLVLDLIIAALAVILISIATAVTGSLSPGALGVALVIVLQFNSGLSQTIQAWTKLETSIGAVARVQQFVQEALVEPAGIVTPAAGWPSRGCIHIHNVVANYGSDDTLPVIANLNLHIAPGEKIAICGPSGSGKTTLIMALMRMINLQNGQITIDAIDIGTVSPAHVRSCLNIIPQDPFFVPGSIRLNVDPHNKYGDDVIESALRKVHLWERMAVGGDVGEGPCEILDGELVASEWSQGERQLLCLARSLLVRSQILILDEATSSVDNETAAIMQNVIEAEFPNQTVISVLHHFTYIDRFDRVAVLGEGSILECDKPQTLLDQQSAFKELYDLHTH